MNIGRALLLCFVLDSNAAIYYISITGDDANDGSTNSPWASYIHAQSNCVAGDTVIVQPGSYYANQSNAGEGYANFNHGGESNNPVVFRANGGVTNTFCFYVTGDGFYFDGFRWEQMTNRVNCVWVALGSDNVTITNCTFNKLMWSLASRGAVVVQTPDTTAANPTNAGSWCRVMNSTFLNLSNGIAVQSGGVGMLIQGNRFDSTDACDIIKPWGTNTLIRLNTFTNMANSGSYGNHPDLLQVFGDNGHWMANAIFERNTVIDCNGTPQFMDFSIKSIYPPPNLEYIPTNSALWGMTLRNNLFINSKMQCSIELPNIKWHNNTFYRCTNGTLLMYGYYDDVDPWSRGWPGGGEVVNNIFAKCPTDNFHPYQCFNAASDQAELTTENAGGGARTGGGYVRMTIGSGSGTNYYQLSGVYSNLSGAVSNGIIRYHGVTNLYEIHATNFSDGVLLAMIHMTNLAGYTTTEQLLIDNTNGFSFAITTSTFPDGDGEIASTRLYQGAISPPADLYTNFNYYGTTTNGPVEGITDPNSIDGGDPGFCDTNSLNFHLLSSSALVGSGTNMTGAFSDDRDGASRIGTWNMGAFEDDGLLLWYTFEDDFANNGYVADISGNNVHGWAFTNWAGLATNFPTRVTASSTDGGMAYAGGYAGDFLWFWDGWGEYGFSGQYAGAATNISGLTNLTAATIALWARHHDAERVDLTNTYHSTSLFLDGGSSTTNTGIWRFGRYGGGYTQFGVHTNQPGTFDTGYQKVHFPDVQDAGGDTTNWNHYAITFTNGSLIGYFNGVEISNAPCAVDALVLHAYDADRKWLALGTMGHDGTPEMETNEATLYPNAGWFNGVLDDVRLYNRVLTSNEVASIAGVGTASGLDGESEPPATNTLQKVTLRGAKVTLRGKATIR